MGITERFLYMGKQNRKVQARSIVLDGKTLKKNDTIELQISDLTSEGEGIGKIDGYVVFVKDALPGEVVKVILTKLKKNYGYGRLAEIIIPSPSRVVPKCQAAKQCGGCQLQHLSYEKQLEFKEDKIRGCLTKIGKLDMDTIEMEPILSMENPFYYRNKAQYPVGKDRNGNIIAGFYAGRTHHIIDTPHCCIQTPVSSQVLEIVKNFMEQYNITVYDEETQTGLVRHILTRVGFVTEEVMVCLIINGTKLPYQDKLVEHLRTIQHMTSISLNFNREHTNVILGTEGKTIWGQDTITDYIGGVKYQISPFSFYQVNPVQTKKLYETALSYADLKGDEIVWDLYCGIGTISLFLAQKAKQVYGVEIVPQAIEDAKRNAELNGITNAEFFVGAAEQVLPEKYQESKEKMAADVIVVDPPRKGCEQTLLDTIVQMAPKRVIYVSCDPATLARDLRYLAERGYEVKKVRGCDMFGESVHVETVVMLSHKKTDSVINVKVEFGEGESKVPLDNIAKRAKAYKPKERVTYKMIKEYIEAKYGFKAHTAYIAEVKRDLGLPMYDAPNAVEELKHPTAEKVEAIKDALKHFGLII